MTNSEGGPHNVPAGPLAVHLEHRQAHEFSKVIAFAMKCSVSLQLKNFRPGPCRPDISDIVYKSLCDKAEAALASQGTVIIDAVF